MKKVRILGGVVLLIVILLPGLARAQSTWVAAGDGVQFSDSGGIFVGYKAGRRLEYQFSSWDGDNANSAFGVGYPLGVGDKIRFGWTPGLALVARTTENLGTNWQFSNRPGLGFRPKDNTEAFFSWIHYSNGNRIFNHDHGPNLGENFITVGFRMRWGGRMSRHGPPPPGLDRSGIR